MLLSNEDIERIRSLGFAKKFFVVERDGWLQLKNYDGRCVFHNGIRCSIYENRPEGCRLYPIIYNEGMKTTFDKDCPYREKFEISENVIQQISDLILKLRYEREQRK
jgi:Fe-S-cluster containining protein